MEVSHEETTDQAKRMDDSSSEDDLKKDLTEKTKITQQSSSAADRDFDIEKYPVRELEVLLPGFQEMVAFNPVVSLIGVTVLWGLSIWCMGKRFQKILIRLGVCIFGVSRSLTCFFVSLFIYKVDPDGSNKLLQEWRSNVTLYFTWTFIGTRVAFFFFLLYVAYKYGHIKLGRKDEPPEFDTVSATNYDIQLDGLCEHKLMIFAFLAGVLFCHDLRRWCGCRSLCVRCGRASLSSLGQLLC